MRPRNYTQCAIPDCLSLFYSKGLCKKHYNKQAPTSPVRPRTCTAATRFNILNRNASIKGRVVELTLDDFIQLQQLPCTYCGGPLPNKGGGIDRIDNRHDYVFGNVAPCCSRCNETKGAIEMAGFVYPRTVALLKERIASTDEWTTHHTGE